MLWIKGKENTLSLVITAHAGTATMDISMEAPQNARNRSAT